MLRHPLRSPFPAHMNVVKFHLLLHHFESRHLRHDVFHPRRNLLSPDHGRIARHQIHPVCRPQRQNSCRIHLQMQLHGPLVENRNLFSPRVVRRSSLYSRRRNQQSNETPAQNHLLKETHPVLLHFQANSRSICRSLLLRESPIWKFSTFIPGLAEFDTSRMIRNCFAT
jgi:hypothetical protein